MKNTAAEYELLTRLIKGDINIFNTIYYQYYNAIYANALKITRDSTAAEDILQEVFVSLWEKRTTINPELSIGGWLFVLSYNKSVNLLRKKLRESLAFKQLNVAEVDAEEVDYNQQYEKMQQAISKLSPQKRKVFEYCKLQGKTYEQTAAEMQISKHTVKEYLSASVTYLKDYVKNHPEASAGIISGLLLYSI